jgi:glutamate dehydrogenase
MKKPQARHTPQARGSRHRQLATRLLRAWRASLPPGDWRTAGAVPLRAAAESQLQFGARRQPRQTLLRVTSPEIGGGRGHSFSVVELITDDMPFLVDTLSLGLAEAGYNVQLIAHPILGAVRGAGGRLLRFGERRGARTAVNESWQYLRIDRIANAQDAEALQARLRAALDDVRHACSDWQAMRQAARGICEQLVANPPPFPAAIVRESAALLEYMEDNHFTFLGFRRSRVQRARGGARLVSIAGSELGVVRNMPPPPLAPLQAAHELLVVTKANHRSTVHRPGYLDVVAVKEFDARGRLCGEAQFRGLWTSNTYHADPRTVPLLRLKVARVIESFPFRPSSHDGKRLVSILENLPRDELFQSSAADLRSCARSVLALHERARGVCLVMRRDKLRHFWSCLVFVGRERLDNGGYRRVEAVLQRALGGGQLDSSLAVGDGALAQLHVTVRVAGHAEIQVRRGALERELDAALVTWRERVHELLRETYDESTAAALDRRYGGGFPAAYQQDVAPAQAVQDIADIDSAAAAGAGQLRLRLPAAGEKARAHLRLLRHGEPLPISEAPADPREFRPAHHRRASL